MLRLADVFDALVHLRPAPAEEMAIGNVVVDSRQVGPGSMFVALAGEKHDGHEYIEDALSKGAIAIICEARALETLEKVTGHSSLPLSVINTGPGIGPVSSYPVGTGPCAFLVPSSLVALQSLASYWRSRFRDCLVIGITGSIGKSSTKELVAAVLRQRMHVLKNQGNLNNEIGLPLTLLQLNENHECAVVEMGMYALGEIALLCGIARPTMGVVTNVGPSHLERLETIERIAQAKGELVEALPEGGLAVLNGDDPLVRAMSSKTRANAFYYGLEPTNDLWADNIESYGLEGIAFDLHYQAEKLSVRMPMLGRHSVHTALAAASVGVNQGLDWGEIMHGLKDTSAQLRLIAVPGENETTLLDDTYNASPESSLAALNLLTDLSGRKVAVLGDMLELGPMEERGHQVVGGRAAQVVSVLIAVGERGKWIGEGASQAGLQDTLFARDNAQAIQILRQVMRTGDIILVKGSRGAKMEEIVSALSRSGENGVAEEQE